MRMTFKDLRKGEKGRFGWVYAKQEVECCLDGEVFIRLLEREGIWRMAIQVDKNAESITGEDPCPWKWVRLTAAFESLDGAKAYIKNNRSRLISMLATQVRSEIEAKKTKG